MEYGRDWDRYGLYTNGCVISGKGKRRVYVKAPQNREWVLILEVISAGGRSIRPLMVFKGYRKRARKVYLSAISEAPERHLVYCLGPAEGASPFSDSQSSGHRGR
jgi:hypothetical protein